MISRWNAGWNAVFVSAALVLCAVQQSGAATTQQSLYDRLGGKNAIVAVVDEFVKRVAADKRINGFFSATASDPKRLARFKGNLVDQICQATGGPCVYQGKDMRTAHRGMGITDADFNALVDDLRGALNAFKVGAQEQSELLALLVPLKKQIVAK